MNTSSHPVAQAWLMYPSWLGYSETMELQFPPEAYEVQETAGGDQWICRVKGDGAVAYEGPGPIRIVDEPIPF